MRRRRKATRSNSVALDKGAAPKTVSLFVPMSLAAEAVDVDVENGILRNVSFISRGPAIGHAMDVDDTTLQQVFDSLKPKIKGVKTRLSHPFLEDGIVARLGRANVKAIDLKAGKVRGDINLGDYSKTTPKGDLWTYVLGLAKEDSDSIGLSIVFEPLPSEARTDDKGNSLNPAARVRDVLAVDLVDDPAANPDGLFSRGDEPADGLEIDAGTEPEPTGESLMNPELKKHLIEKCGLKADATDAEALAFMFELPAEKRTEATALLSKPVEPEPKPEPAPKVPAPPEPAPPVNAAAERKLERERVASITTLAVEYGLPETWAKERVDGEVSFADARLAALESYAKAHKPVSVSVGSDLNVDTLGLGMADALCSRAGIPIFDRGKTVENVRRWGRRGYAQAKPGESALALRDPHPRAQEFGHMSLLDIGRTWLRSLGVPGVDGMSRTAVATYMLSAQARFKDFRNLTMFVQSTSDFDFILADVLGKSLLAAYVEAPRTWPVWTRRTTAPDFKSLKFIKLSTSPDLAVIPEGGEMTFGVLEDEQETVALAKYGKALKLTLEAIVNDDLSAFDRIPMLHGNAAARLEDDTVWAILTANPTMADGVALFHATHANLAAGVGVVGAPSVATLDIANASFRLQTAFAPTGETGPILNLRPATIMVPAALDGTTAQLLRSVTDPTATASGVANRWAGNVLTQVTEGRLDGSSSTGWYMATDPNQCDTVVVVFLEGEEVPVLADETVFGTGDKKYGIRHTVAAKAVDHRGLYLNPGV